jgi:hypothetical protein
MFLQRRYFEMENKMPITKLTGAKVWEALKNGMTLQELGKRYDTSEEKFLENARSLVGSSSWTQISNMDRKNSKNAKRRKPKIIKQEESAMKDCEDLKAKCISVEDELQNTEELMERSRVLLQEAETEKAKIEEETERIMKLGKEVQKKIKEEKAKQATYVARIEKLLEEQAVLYKKIKDLNKVYLVSPDYDGELPDGKLVSVSELADNVCIETGEELIKKPEFIDILESGFKEIQDYAMALEFAKLVIKYILTNKDYELLVNNECTIRVLRGQGIEV